jgi:hypothetical protein
VNAIDVDLAVRQAIAGDVYGTALIISCADATDDATDAAGDGAAITASQLVSAFVLLQRAMPQAAIDVLNEWHAGAGDLTSAWDRGLCTALLGYASFAAGDSERARFACAEAEQLLALVDDDWLTGHLDATLGQLAQIELRYPDVAMPFERAVHAARRAGLTATEGFHLDANAQQDGDVQVIALDALALVEAHAGHAALAVDLLARSDELMHSPGHRITEHDRIDARHARSLLALNDETSAQ